jgi:uncharacterized membrane protein YphA (DoxX/SURF4 family)
MKYVLGFSRIFTGLLFIFSGLVKANDPVGLSYKMQEFFEKWNFSSLNDYTLSFSVLMIAFEIIAGVAVLLGWRMRLFSWLLLLLILFFTFLTGYAYLSDEIHECGCFGDCIPLTAKQSFIKDLILLALILLIFMYRNRIKPVFAPRICLLLILIAAFLSFGSMWYTLKYLPVVDCLPYKKGNNIAEKMKIPADAKPDVTEIVFIYEKNGKTYSFSSDTLKFITDLNTYTYKSRDQRIIEKGNAVAPIKDFMIKTLSGNDSTNAILSMPGTVCLYFILKEISTNESWKDDFSRVVAAAKAKNIPVYAVCGQGDTVKKVFDQWQWTDVVVTKGDATSIKTAARTTPCLYVLEQGTVKGKWSFADLKAGETFIKQAKTNPAPVVPTIPVTRDSLTKDSIR